MNDNKHKITKKKNKKAHKNKNKKTRTSKKMYPKALNIDLEGGVRKGAFSDATAENLKQKKINENISNNCTAAENDPVKDFKKARDILGLPQGFMKEDPEKRDKMLKKARSYKLSICNDANIKKAMKDINVKKYSENIEKAFEIINNQIKAEAALQKAQEDASEEASRKKLQEEDDKEAVLCKSALKQPISFEDACAVLEIDPDFINEENSMQQLETALAKKKRNCPNPIYQTNIELAAVIIENKIKVKKNEMQKLIDDSENTIREGRCNTAENIPQNVQLACSVLELNPTFLDANNAEDQLRIAYNKKMTNCGVFSKIFDKELSNKYATNIKKAFDILTNEINKRKRPQEEIELTDIPKKAELDAEEEEEDVEDDVEEDVEDTEDLEQELEKLQLQDLRQIAIQTKCDAENEDYKGVGINTQLYNNCYLNAVLQMLYHMCYFREGLLSEEVRLPSDRNDQAEAQQNAVEDLKTIFGDYAYALQNNQSVIKLQSDILNDIKLVSKIDPNQDGQEDPSQVIYNLLPIINETTNNLSDNTIFGANNAQIFERTAPFSYIYSLSLASASATSLQALITANPNTLQHINQSLSTRRDTDMQRYMIFQIARYDIINRATPKKINIINPNPFLQFTYQKDQTDITAQFRLKGIIVHIGSTINNGHYIYITYAKNGNISGIYNNGEVTTINDRNINRTGSSGGPLDITTILKDTRPLVNQNGYLFLYEIMNDLPDEPLHPVLPNTPSSPPSNQSQSPVLPDVPTDQVTQPLPANQNPIAAAVTAITPVIALQHVKSDEEKITEATRIAKKLFGIPDNKTVDKVDLHNRQLQLEYKIKKYCINPDKDLFLKIIINAKLFLYEIPQSLTRFDPTYKDKLKSFFNRMSTSDKVALVKFSENFVPQYKELTFNQSTIVLKPKILDNTKTKKIGEICGSVSKLSRQIYTRKIIPSQLPNLLEKKDIPETKKIFINERKKREQRVNEETEKKKIEVNKEKEKEIQDQMNKLRELYKNADKLKEGTIKQQIQVLTKRLNHILSDPALANPSEIKSIQAEIEKMAIQLDKKVSAK